MMHNMMSFKNRTNYYWKLCCCLSKREISTVNWNPSLFWGVRTIFLQTCTSVTTIGKSYSVFFGHQAV